MRWQDLFGVTGLALVVLGTVLMFPSSRDRMHWAFLLSGSILWLAGFATVTGWVAWRWSISQQARGERNAYTPEERLPGERREKDRRSQPHLAA